MMLVLVSGLYSTAEKLPTKDGGSSQLVVKMQPHSISSRNGSSKGHNEVIDINFPL